MRDILTLALAGFTEARRNRVTLVIVAFALAMISATSVVLNMTIFTFDRVASDFGLGVMSLLLVGLAIFLGSTQLSREIDRRTVFLVLSKPISRTQFVLGRVFGTVLTLWAMQLAMAALFFAQVAVLDLYFTQAQVAAIAGLTVELALLASLGALFSSVSGPLVASLSSVGIYLIGHGASDLWELANTSKSALIKTVGRGLYWVIPQLDRLDYRPAASYATTIDWSKFGVSAVYALGYAGILLVAATAAFRRVDFK
jgi:ABC-type transport system involved in multi-copper enzyme maturation permease subunit